MLSLRRWFAQQHYRQHSRARGTRRLLRLEILESRRLLAKVPLTDVPVLNSHPDAVAQLYLDFDGHAEADYHGAGRVSVTAFDRDGDPTTFDEYELDVIRQVFATIAEDYAPFRVNVTTARPPDALVGAVACVAFGPSVVGGENSSFSEPYASTGPNVSWVVTGYGPETDSVRDGITVGAVGAHEAGHGYGLDHKLTRDQDGVVVDAYAANDYDTAPTMGAAAYGKERSVWWVESADYWDYYSPREHDIAVIAGSISYLGGGSGFRADDYGDTAATATPLVRQGHAWKASGVIGTAADVDVFSFTTSGGRASFSVAPPARYGNLDAELELRDSAGSAVIAMAAPNDRWDAALHADLQPGSYRLYVRSNGQYGDVGTYEVSGRFLAFAGDVIQSPGEAPSDLVVQANPSGSVTLRWRDNSTSETRFVVEALRNNVSLGSFTAAANAELWTQSGLRPGTYRFRVGAVQPDSRVVYGSWATGIVARGSDLVLEGEQLTLVGKSGPFTVSNQTVHGTTFVGASSGFMNDWTDFQFNAPTDGSYRLSATMMTGPQYGEVQLWVNGKSIGSVVDGAAAQAGTLGSTYFGIVSLHAGRNSFRVQVLGPTNYLGCQWGIDRLSFTPVLESPIANEPTSVTAAADANGNVTVSWEDNSIDEQGFLVSLDFSTYASVPANTTSHTFAGMPQGRYRVDVVPVRANGVSSVACREALFVQVQPLAAPTNVQATLAGPDSIDLTWDYFGSGQTGFKITQYRDGSIADQPAPVVVDAAARRYRATGLQPNYVTGSSVFAFRISATNARIESDAAAPATAVKIAAPPVTVTMTADKNQVAEDFGTVVITAALSAVSTHDIYVNLGFGGTAVFGSDFVASSSDLTIRAGSLSGTCTLRAIGDSESDSNESLVVEIVNVRGALENGQQSATVTIIDAWAVPTITQQPANQTIPVGNTARFTAAASGTPAPSVQWQVSTNGGMSWSDIVGATSPTYSFAVDLAQSGNLYRAVFTNTAGSTSTTAAMLTVTSSGPVNHAPVLSGAANFTTITEDQTRNSGDPVSNLIAGKVTDVDSGALSGIAVTGLVSDAGMWQYSTNGGKNWRKVGTVSAVSALLLRSSDRLRFVPDGKNGTAASVTFRAWDQTSGVRGTKVNPGAGGGTSAFSTASMAASLTVASVNNAPVLRGANRFTGIARWQTANTGDLVSTLLRGKVTDLDTGAVQGIAVTGLSNGRGGRWQYSTDNGSTWIDVAAVSTSQALLLRSTDRLRFVPNGKKGTASVTFRAWDQTGTTAGKHGTKLSAALTGGTNPFSAAAYASKIVVS